MKAVIKYRIDSITEDLGYHNGKICTQKTAIMNVVAPLDPNDPNYAFGQLSGGSQQKLSTVNPNVFSTWRIGAIVVCEMEIE